MGGKIILNSVEYVGGDSPAIVDVNELPTNNISKDTFYRKSEDVYIYQRQVLDPSNTVWYGDGPNGYIEEDGMGGFTAFDENGDFIGDYFIDTLSTGQVNSLLNSGIIAVKDSLAESKFFGTPDFFGFSESVTIERGNYKLFHNPTSSPGKYIEVTNPDRISQSIIDDKESTTAVPCTKAVYLDSHPDFITTLPTKFAPNVAYSLGHLPSPHTIVLDTSLELPSTPNFYFIQFQTLSTPPTITWPSNWLWLGGSAPILNANHCYEIVVFSIGTNYTASCLEF